MATDEQVISALRQVMHPELKRDVVELGRVRDAVVQDGGAAVALALPFIDVPISDDLVDSTREALSLMKAGLGR
jgi:ATP-binding protein involved in chromosome partitioning